MNMQTMRAEIARRVKLRERLELDETLTREEYVDAMEPDWSEIGGELKEQRLRYGLSLAETARQTGFSASTLRKFENGQPVMRAKVIHRSYDMLFEVCMMFDILENARQHIADLEAELNLCDEEYEEIEDMDDFNIEDEITLEPPSVNTNVISLALARTSRN